MKFTMTALRRAIRAELDAEGVAEAAEEERRRAWWQTTWMLAAADRSQWGEARDLYCQQTRSSKKYAAKRRQTGQRLTESPLAGWFPMPRMSMAAAEVLGASPSDEDVALLVDLLQQADREGASIREFHEMLTLRRWSRGRMDEDEEIERARRTMTDPEKARAVLRDPEARGITTRAGVEAYRDDLDFRKPARAGNRAQPKEEPDARLTGGMAHLGATMRAEGVLISTWRTLHRGVKEWDESSAVLPEDSRPWFEELINRCRRSLDVFEAVVMEQDKFTAEDEAQFQSWEGGENR